MIPFSKPSLGPEEEAAVVRVLRSGWLACGAETAAFEDEFSTYISPAGEKYFCIFTNSCTAALKIAYKWYREFCGSQIYYPLNTFCATYAAAVESGLEIVGYPTGDEKVKPGRVNMHYGGVKDETPCIIEDSAHRIEPNDSLVGKIRCYSFYVTKNMTTGQGGMFVTNDPQVAEFARLCWKDGLTTSTADRHSGQIRDYEVKVMAGGYDGNDLAAAIGREQLKKLPALTLRRNEIRDRYNAALQRTWPGNHIYPYFVNSLEDVTGLRQYLQELGVATSYMYPGTGWTGVSLPIYPAMADLDVEEVINKVKSF
jgi:dTDP-4-amino-4,6-dideoxygalactose transaminase